MRESPHAAGNGAIAQELCQTACTMVRTTTVLRANSPVISALIGTSAPFWLGAHAFGIITPTCPSNVRCDDSF